MTTIRCLAAVALALGAAIFAMTALQSTPAQAFPGTIMAGSDVGNAVRVIRDGRRGENRHRRGSSGIGDTLDTLDDLGLLEADDDDDDNDISSCLWLHRRYESTGNVYWLNRYRRCLRDSG